MVTIDPDANYAEEMEDLIVVLVPERKEGSDERIEPPRVVSYKELDPLGAAQWIMQETKDSLDELEEIIKQLSAALKAYASS
ncbi:MAG: hypothetical protein V3R16_09645 [Nitrospirales bacterium]